MMKDKTNRSQKHPIPFIRDVMFEGRNDMEVDIDRMVNEGLGGGQVDPGVNGSVDNSTPGEDLID